MMKTQTFLLLTLAAFVRGQVNPAPSRAMVFVELKALKINAYLIGEDEVTSEETLRSRAFVELQKQLPVIEIDGDARDVFTVSLYSKKLAGKEQNFADDFYFAILEISLKRDAILEYVGSYYGGFEPKYKAEVWGRLAYMWGSADHIQEQTKKYLEDTVTFFAADYYAAKSELEKNRDSGKKK